MPRNGTAADLKWFEIEPCYVFHPMNAYERGTGDDLELVLDVGRFNYMWRKGSKEFDNVALLHRWVIQVAKGTTYEEQLDDRPAEFARVADSVVGLPNRFGYMAGTRPGGGEAVFSTEIFKYDLTTKTSQVHSYGPNRRPGEAVFVADPNGTAEDHGWLLNYVWDATTDTSDLVIVDSRDFIGAPIATIHLPRRIPFGFHGSWIPAL
jgi:carotenoid cleavage oxygenase